MITRLLPKSTTRSKNILVALKTLRSLATFVQTPDVGSTKSSAYSTCPHCITCRGFLTLREKTSLGCFSVLPGRLRRAGAVLSYFVIPIE